MSAGLPASCPSYLHQVVADLEPEMARFASAGALRITYRQNGAWDHSAEVVHVPLKAGTCVDPQLVPVVIYDETVRPRRKYVAHLKRAA